MKYFWKVAVLVYAVSISQGCVSNGVFRPGEFSYAIVSGSPSPIDDIRIHWEEYGHNFDDKLAGLPSALGKFEFGDYFDYSPARIPSSVDAAWKSADGQQHQKKIDLDHELPEKSSFAGTIFLKFFDNDVRVVPVPEWLQERNQRLGKSTAP